jgi:hypothetical protein
VLSLRGDERLFLSKPRATFVEGRPTSGGRSSLPFVDALSFRARLGRRESSASNDLDTNPDTNPDTNLATQRIRRLRTPRTRRVSFEQWSVEGLT